MHANMFKDKHVDIEGGEVRRDHIHRWVGESLNHLNKWLGDLAMASAGGICRKVTHGHVVNRTQNHLERWKNISTGGHLG